MTRQFACSSTRWRRSNTPRAREVSEFATLTYDPLDRVATRTATGSSARTFAYVGASDLAWQVPSGTADARLLTGSDGSQPGVSRSGTAKWLLPDLLGSVALAEPATTSITTSDALRTDAWGTAIGTYPSTGSDLAIRFRGLVDLAPTADPDASGTGSDALYEMGARTYSPHTGSFSSLDTYPGSATNPISMSRYLYAHASPATLIDPTGHKVTEQDSAGTPNLFTIDDTKQAAQQHNSSVAKSSTPGTTTTSTGTKRTAGGSVPPPTRDDYRTRDHVLQLMLDPVAFDKQMRRNACEWDPASMTCVLGTGRDLCDEECTIGRAEVASIIDPTPISGIVLSAYYCPKGDGPNCGVNLLAAIPLVGGRVKSSLKAGLAVAEHAARFGPTNPGPLHLLPNATKIVGSFRSGAYTEVTLADAITLYRVYGGASGQLGAFWTRTEPAGPLQAQLDLALRPEWNTLTDVVTIRVPAGTTVYEGVAGSQPLKGGGSLLGGGGQVYVPRVEPEWVVQR